MGPVEKVSYGFEAAGVTDVWRVHRIYVDEALSTPYLVELSLASVRAGADPLELLGKSCRFTMSRAGVDRCLSGIVKRVEQLGQVADHALARITVVPALAALAFKAGSRMFQDMTVPEIVQKVLAQGLEPYQRRARLEVERAYPKREYCLQQNESDLAFVARLLAEEGIFYWFDQSAEHEEMVLHDRNGSCQPFAADDPVVDVMGPAAELAAKEAVREFASSQELRPTTMVVREFDWTRPALDVTERKKAASAPAPEREVYRYSPPLTLSGYDEGEGRYTADDRAVKARLRSEEEEAQRTVGAGHGYVTRFAVGTTFELASGSPELDRQYLITGVVHEGDAPEELVDSQVEPGAGAGERYRNRFTCIPLDVPFRPVRPLARPRIPGLQSAVVVGPANEEIYTDQHGRIRVRFPWDREATGDDKSSFWVRVAQVWSGGGWGFVFIPRVGMEVLVAFMDGDPDRPLVVGCAYNGANRTPYKLPDEKTKSTIRTSSSPGNNGFNELRFEDLAGEEEIFLHAQKDMNVVILHDRTTKIGHDETQSVDRHRSRLVRGNETVSVNGNQDETIGGNRSETVLVASQESVTLAKDLTIGTGYQVDVGAGMNETVGASKGEEIGGDKTVNVGASSTESIAKNKTVTAGGNLQARATKDVEIKSGEATAVVSGKNMSLKVGQSFLVSVGKKGIIEITDELVLKCGGATISMKKNGDISIKGNKISIKGDGDVVIKGSKVSEN